MPGRLSYFFTIDPFKARRLLKSLSIKQGIKYDAPESAVDIAPFIALYELNVNEMLDPPNSFSASVNIFLSAVSKKVYNQKLSMSFSIGDFFYLLKALNS